MALSPEKQLAIDTMAANNDWPQEQIDSAVRHAELTSEGQTLVAEAEQEMTEHDEQMARGLGITGLSAEQQVSLNELARTGADQERIDAVEANMRASR